MTNLAHITETALLLLVVYLLGCMLGYAARRILHAGRGTRQVVVPPSAAAPSPPSVAQTRSPARRLAASVGDDLPPAQSGASVVEASISANKARTASAKPTMLAVPRTSGKDNLKQIKGIGPKIEASLYALGIFHLDQIAGWSQADVDWIDATLALKGRIRRERWVEQAIELGKVNAEA